MMSQRKDACLNRYSSDIIKKKLALLFILSSEH